MLDMLDVEITTEFLIVRFTNQGEGDERVLGFFIQDVPVGTREQNSMLIKRCWEKFVDGTGGVPNLRVTEQSMEERAVPMPGQRLSVSDLFGRQLQ